MATKLLLETIVLLGIYWVMAFNVVRSTIGASKPDDKAANVAILAEDTSAFGETLS